MNYNANSRYLSNLYCQKRKMFVNSGEKKSKKTLMNEKNNSAYQYMYVIITDYKTNQS